MPWRKEQKPIRRISRCSQGGNQVLESKASYFMIGYHCFAWSNLSSSQALSKHAYTSSGALSRRCSGEVKSSSQNGTCGTIHFLLNDPFIHKIRNFFLFCFLHQMQMTLQIQVEWGTTTSGKGEVKGKEKWKFISM